MNVRTIPIVVKISHSNKYRGSSSSSSSSLQSTISNKSYYKNNRISRARLQVSALSLIVPTTSYEMPRRTIDTIFKIFITNIKYLGNTRKQKYFVRFFDFWAL